MRLRALDLTHTLILSYTPRIFITYRRLQYNGFSDFLFFLFLNSFLLESSMFYLTGQERFQSESEIPYDLTSTPHSLPASLPSHSKLINVSLLSHMIMAKKFAKITVIIPAVTIASELIAPSVSPSSIALAVPIACALVPSASPTATGSVI